VLVDRLWPRGLSKQAAAIDLWLRDVAPSTELRRWFGHDVGRWVEFQRRYAAELHSQQEALDRLLHLAQDGPLTLVFSARDAEHNDAVVLHRLLLQRAGHRAV
jgi:uncharacterized protein YeaO (DUF488 family)